MVKKFITEEEGATGIEYALFASLIAAAVIASVQALGGAINATYHVCGGVRSAYGGNGELGLVLRYRQKYLSTTLCEEKGGLKGHFSYSYYL